MRPRQHIRCVYCGWTGRRVRRSCECPSCEEGYPCSRSRFGRCPSCGNEKSLEERNHPREPRQRVCLYCYGVFTGTKATCSSACEEAVREARDADEALAPWARRDAHSEERQAATGWGWMTPTERYQADRRVRGEIEELLPGGDPERWEKVWYRMGRRVGMVS